MNNKWQTFQSGVTPCFECKQPLVLISGADDTKVECYKCTNQECVTNLSNDEWFENLQKLAGVLLERKSK